MPWNFPFWQGVPLWRRQHSMAGNVILLKACCECVRMRSGIEKIFKEAEFTDGVFRALITTNDGVSRSLPIRELRRSR